MFGAGTCTCRKSIPLTTVCIALQTSVMIPNSAPTHTSEKSAALLVVPFPETDKV